jgi:hypothetical protein
MWPGKLRLSGGASPTYCVRAGPWPRTTRGTRTTRWEDARPRLLGWQSRVSSLDLGAESSSALARNRLKPGHGLYDRPAFSLPKPAGRGSAPNLTRSCDRPLERPTSSASSSATCAALDQPDAVGRSRRRYCGEIAHQVGGCRRTRRCWISFDAAGLAGFCRRAASSGFTPGG